MIRDSQQTHKKHKTKPWLYTRHFPFVVALYSPLSPVCKIVEISKYWNDNFNLGFKSRQASQTWILSTQPQAGKYILDEDR